MDLEVELATLSLLQHSGCSHPHLYDFKQEPVSERRRLGAIEASS